MSILNIGKSALAAAQIGINTTGHNIANASTPGYSRQEIVQSAAPSQNFGFGFVGQGTEVATVKRIYDNILAAQMVKSQSSSSAANAYSTQMNALDNMLSDPKSGLNAAMSDFFGSVQDLSANPSDIATRQSMLSNAQSLASRFQSTNARLDEVREGVNTQITTGLSLVNIYAKQIASLNETIEKAVNTNGNPPNDLMDQRDALVLELSKQIKTTVVPQGQGSYNIYVGNGLPLVVGNETRALIPIASPTDPTRIEVAYQSNGNVAILGLSSLPGGTIGGLLQFRAESLDPIQNQVGQIAAVLAETYNSQLQLGFDKNGVAGTALFGTPVPVVTANANNTGNGVVTSSIVDAKKLTSSDYRLQWDGTNYKITRLSDNAVTTSNTLPLSIDGLEFQLSSGTPTAGDDFVISPTRNAAAAMSVLITDPDKIAVGGSATSGPGDNQNGLLLVGLQNAKNITNNKSYTDAFSQMVNGVGNKTREINVLSYAEAQVLEQTNSAVQSVSGVNLDEEATNLIRYQQAYQAAGKMMQIASQLFDVLLNLGR